MSFPFFGVVNVDIRVEVDPHPELRPQFGSFVDQLTGEVAQSNV